MPVTVVLFGFGMLDTLNRTAHCAGRCGRGNAVEAMRSFAIDLSGLEDDLGPPVNAVIEVLIRIHGFAEGNLVGDNP